MNFNQKLASLFSLIAIASQFDACADDAQMRNLESRVSALEARRSPCMVNPPARPTQKCDFGGYLTIDPLLLKAQENGLEFAVRTQNAGQVAASVENFLAGKSKIKSLDFEWDWGFRLALGANLAHDGWDVYTTWTWFRTHANKHVSVGPTQFLSTIFMSEAAGGDGPSGFDQGLVSSAASHWRLRYNALNLEAGREFFVSKWLVLKPHGGVTTAWIRQKDFVTYDGFQLPSAVTPFAINSNARMKNNFWGIGLRFGLETQWGIGCGWSAFGDASASLLYGYFKIDHIENDVLSDTTVNSPLFSASNFYHVDRFIADFIAGIRYDYMFCDERYHLGFQVGWEHHMFFGQNQFPKFVGFIAPGVFVANQGDLTLQGVSAQVRFDF